MPPLPKQQLGFRLGSAVATNLMDVFIDISCPFSKKIFKTLLKVHDWAECTKKDSFSVRFIITPQPWHPQSPVMAEAIFAVQKIDPSKTVEFTDRLLDVVESQFYDNEAYNKSRAQMHSELAVIASALVPAEAFSSLLAYKGPTPNAGNEITQEVKWHVKYHRACGVHVTPTCFMNNIEASEISSSWTLEQWQEFLTPFI